MEMKMSDIRAIAAKATHNVGCGANETIAARAAIEPAAKRPVLMGWSAIAEGMLN